MSNAAENQGVEIEGEASPDVEATEQQAPERDWEAEASKMGWVPEHKFKGDPARWSDAQTFVRKGEEYIPFIRAENRKFQEQLSSSDELIKSQKKQIEEMAKYLNKAEETGYKKALDEYKQMQKQAFEQGDEEKFNLASEKLDELAKEQPKKIIDVPDEPKQEAKNDQNEVTDPDLIAWHKENPWYDNDPAMQAYAHSVTGYLNATRPDIKTNREYYDAITAMVKQQFSSKFENRKQTAPSDVVEAPSGGGKRIKKRSFDSLPPEAKAACERFMQHSKDPEAMKENYLKNYDWEE